MNWIAKSAVAALGLMGILQAPAKAIFIPGEQVPVERLISNVGKRYEKMPKDAATVYTLGRLHSLAFSRMDAKASVLRPRPGQENGLPVFSGGDSFPYMTDQDLTPRKKSAVAHLQSSLSLYRKAVALVPTNGVYWFGYAWMLDQGRPFATEVNAPFRTKPSKTSGMQWRAEALKAYRKAFALTSAADLKRQMYLQGSGIIVSKEAAVAVLESFKGRNLSKSESAEKVKLEAHLKKIAAIPMAVTPLIFPLGNRRELSQLADRSRTSRFDLMADRSHRTWEWVSPDTGILVWDPAGNGKITTGKQLFGSVTWWIFWKNGFEPLAALDDDRNGFLEGRELRGIAVWQDKNSNGKSDAGEVISVQTLGVVRLAVRASAASALFNDQGVVMQDGSTRPLYDWVPVSKAK